MPSLCIVGAGAAGLAAAHALADSSLSVTVAEKSRGLGGRAATRWRDAPDAAGAPFRWRYDHGAQYASPPEGTRAYRLLTERLDTDGLVRIERPVWPFGDDGTLRPDQARAEGAPRLTYRDGIADLGRRLADATPGLDLRRQTRVAHLAKTPAGWAVTDTEGAQVGRFDAVLFTPPPPQTLGLVAASAMDDAPRDALLAGLRPASYRRQFTVVLAFPEGAPRPEPYALVNPSGGHAVAWLAVESDKPGRAPEGATLFLAQMAPAWTDARYDADRDAVVRDATAEIESLVGALPEPAWADTQRWRYALPDTAADPDALAPAEAAGLFAAGDAIAGQGRVHLALESGLAAADRIRGFLG